jgi:hypothetical protein
MNGFPGFGPPPMMGFGDFGMGPPPGMPSMPHPAMPPPMPMAPPPMPPMQGAPDQGLSPLAQMLLASVRPRQPQVDPQTMQRFQGALSAFGSY